MSTENRMHMTDDEQDIFDRICDNIESWISDVRPGRMISVISYEIKESIAYAITKEISKLQCNAKPE